MTRDDSKKARGADPHRDVPRDVLPIPHRRYAGLITYDARDPNSKFAPIQPVRPPAGAPNVLVVLLDDVGFAASSAFGGAIHMPVCERLAKGGLKYTRFHTTAMCSPTRQALLTGRNHHSVGMAGITEIATSAPGYSSIRPNDKATLPEILKLNGYSTAQFGKCHEIPVWQTSPLGPFDQWPTGGGGFEYFYGFIGGETNQYAPALYEGTKAIEPSKTPEHGYHLTEDLADKAITWIHEQKALMPDKPFFVYFAPGATHAPHHVPKEWSDRYKGKFDEGWDKLREQILARQKKLGVVPKDAQLTKRHAEIPAWDDMPEEMKPILAREMEVYAGFLEHTDHHVGRVIDAIDGLGVLDDTLIIYILGDNGASGEGGINGTFNENLAFNAMTSLETPDFLKARIDAFGSPEAYNHYAVGWAHALDTPYQWTKLVASHWGGTRNGTIVHWPNGIESAGELRHQFTHVIDVAPTILEAARLPEPTLVHGVLQSPMEGTSMAYSFDAADAPERHDLQYFEMLGNRGIYFRGWSAITKHRTPWVLAGGESISFDDDVWELYDGSKDWTQAHDLAKEMPDKLRELQRLWLIEAARYNVLPLDDRASERVVPELAGRPELARGTSQRFYAGMGRLPEHVVVSVKNTSFTVTAAVEVPKDGAEGVVIAQGGQFGGWSLQTTHSKAKFVYNLCGVRTFEVEAQQALSPGKHELRAEFAYDGGGLAKGGTVSLFYDGAAVGQGRVDQTIPFVFSADETVDIGHTTGTPVSSDYGAHDGTFTGEIEWVQLEAGRIDESQLIPPEERIRIALTRQ